MYFKSACVTRSVQQRSKMTLTESSNCDIAPPQPTFNTSHPAHCHTHTHTNSMHTVLLLLYTDWKARWKHWNVWRPTRCRIPQRVGDSEESPRPDVQPGAVRALQSIWNWPSVHETAMETTANKNINNSNKKPDRQQALSDFPLCSQSSGSHSCAEEGKASAQHKLDVPLG